MPLGGYSVNGNTSYIPSDLLIKIESKIIEIYNTIYYWMIENWRLFSISIAIFLMILSLFLMIIAYCNDQRRKRAKENKKYKFNLAKISSNKRQNNQNNNYNELEPSAPLLQTDIKYNSNSYIETKATLLSPNLYKVEGM